MPSGKNYFPRLEISDATNLIALQHYHHNTIQIFKPLLSLSNIDFTAINII
jgi:hypothetical protein